MAERIQPLVTAERRLLQDVSHELRAPLARLNVAAELARTAPDRQAAIDRVQRDLDRLGSLVMQLIETTRAEGDPGAQRTATIDVASLVLHVAEDCGLDASRRNCKIEVSVSATSAVQGDPELLRRAVENVLRNAVQHAPENADVDVAVREHAAQAEIEIRDRGPGVPEDALTRIFDSFYRVDSSRTSSTGGIGLGLAIARRAVQLHQGTIRAENAFPGLRVTIALPIVRDSPV
jgi:two-component system sensor histidine kinase CpxA